MATKTLLDRVQPYASGWARTGTRSLLRLAQEGQDELLDADVYYNRFISTDNKGFPPYLKTTAETYKYEITNANLSATLTKNIGGTAYVIRARQVLAVFLDVRASDYGYERRWIGLPYIYYFSNPYSSNVDRKEVSRIPVGSYPALESTAAYIEFKEDPGTSTDKYFIEFTWEAPRLVSENIPLVVPEMFESALEDYIIGKIQWFENGKYNERLERFENIWKPKMQKIGRVGAQPNDLQVMPRVC